MASDVLTGVPGILPSFLKKGESFLMESDDGALPAAGSTPGTGDGALDPLIAATLRI
jgi:hypothetical protein